jgi:hypothetical protein
MPLLPLLLPDGCVSYYSCSCCFPSLSELQVPCDAFFALAFVDVVLRRNDTAALYRPKLKKCLWNLEFRHPYLYFSSSAIIGTATSSNNSNSNNNSNNP